MSDSRTALMILLFAALPAGLLTTGCNPDTRELLLDPRLPVAEPYTGGAWTSAPVLTCGRSVYALAAWSRDDVLMIGRDGLAVRVQAGQARNVDLPGGFSLFAAVAQPDGSALVSAGDGAIYRLSGGIWSVDLGLGGHLLAMWRSADGVVLGVGDFGRGLRRLSDGAWEPFDTGAGERLTGLWGRSADDCWAVGDGGVVAHFDGETWSVERPFGEDANLERTVSGDEDGRVAVVADGIVRLREAGIWRDLPQLSTHYSARGVAFVTGQLLAWNSQQVCRWDGVAWIVAATLSGTPACATVGEDALLLAPSGNGLVRFAAGQLETLLPALDSISDLESTPDGTVILTSNNWILREIDTGWRIEVQLDDHSTYGSGRLVRSANGALLAFTGALFRETPAGWETPTSQGGRRYDSLFPLSDGTLLLEDVTGIWTWADDRQVLLCRPPEDWPDLSGVAGDSPRDALYLFGYRLARYDGVALQPAATLSYGFCLSRDPVEGMLLYGYAGLFALDGASTLDLTPRCAEWGEVKRAKLSDFAVAPTGDWLAWTWSGRLLRRRAGLWQSLDGVDGYPLLYRYPAAAGRSIRAGDGGDLLLFSASHIFNYRDATP